MNFAEMQKVCVSFQGDCRENIICVLYSIENIRVFASFVDNLLQSWDMFDFDKNNPDYYIYQ